MPASADEPRGGPPTYAGSLHRTELAAAANASTLRLINEAIEEGRVSSERPVAFVCECGQLGCDSLVELSLDEYEAVRSDARRFLVTPGHEQPDDVIDARHARYFVTSKRGSAADAALRADPRADRANLHLLWTRSRTVPALSVEFAATADSVRRVRRLVWGFAAERGADPDLLNRIALSVSEAATNAVLHAYPPSGPGAIHVSADVEGGALEIVVADDGTGLRATADHGGLGLGLPVLARCCDRFGVRERRPHGTEIWMRFTLTG